MIRTTGFALAALLVLPFVGSRGAWASNEQNKGGTTDEADDDDDKSSITVTGKRPPPLPSRAPAGATPGERVDSGRESAISADDLAALKARPHPPQVYRAAEVLKLDLSYTAACWYAVQNLYERDYKGAKEKFDKIAVDYPGTGVAHVGRALVWQSLMLENFDFAYDSQYQVAFKQAKGELEVAVLTPGNEAWEHFLLGGLLGVDAIHVMRKGEYVGALARGVEAMKSVNKSKDLAPGFVDLTLGDGLYNYWRTVVTMSSKALPDFGDRRQEGIEQMQKVEREGTFLVAPARLALTYTWIEEGELKTAAMMAMRNHRQYPNNVINNLTLGRIYMYQRMWDGSEKMYKQVLAVAPENQRVHYHLGQLYLRSKRLPEAEVEIDRYLTYKLEPSYQASGLCLKGDLYFRQKKYDQASEFYKQAYKLDKVRRAKVRLEKIKKLQ